MKFQVGDKILVLHSNEEGEIIEIINNEMVLIDVAGVQFPIYMDQIDFPYFKQFTAKKEIKTPSKIYIDQIPIEKKQLETIEMKNISLQCMPVFETDSFGEEIIREMKLYLVNQTEQDVQFSYQLTLSGKHSFELNNIILAYQNFYIHNILFENWSDNPVFNFHFTLLKPKLNKVDHFKTFIKIKPKQLFNKIEELKVKNEPALVFPLFEEWPNKKEEDIIDIYIPKPKNNQVFNASKAADYIEQPRSIIDLHIEKLTDNWQQLNNFEILQLQIQTFEKYYDLAIAHYQPTLIVIHGLGTGRLRNEIHDLLKYKTEVKSFINQYDSRFGYGATEIIFQY